MNFAPFSFLNQGIPIPSGFAFYYNSNDALSYPGTGTTWFDLSTNDYDATLNNGPVFNTGSINYFSFDGINDFGNVANSGSFGSNTGNFTVGGWIRFSTANVFHGIASRGRDGSGAGWSIFVGVSTTNKPLLATVYPSPTTQRDTNGNTNLNTNTWYNIMGVVESNSIQRVYLNGVQDATTSLNQTTLRSSDTYWDIGRINNTYFAQDLTEVIVYHSALSPTQIKQYFDATKSRYGY